MKKLIPLLIILISGCSTAKELLDKAERKDPAIVAQYARDKYPCTDLLKPDTVTMYEDSLVFIECPDSNYSANDYAIVRTDTIYKPGESKMVRVPVKILVPSKVITKWYEDSAKLKLMTLEISRLKTELSKTQSDLKQMTVKRDWFRKYFYIESGILFILLILAIWRLWKRATTIKFK